MRKSGIGSENRINKETIKPSGHTACMPLKPDLKNGLSTRFFAVNTSTSLCCRRVSTKLLGQAETSEDRGMVNGGVVEWNGVVSGEWWLVMEWWFGGSTKSCLCVSFSLVAVTVLSWSYVGGTPDPP